MSEDDFLDAAPHEAHALLAPHLAGACAGFEAPLAALVSRWAAALIAAPRDEAYRSARAQDGRACLEAAVSQDALHAAVRRLRTRLAAALAEALAADHLRHAHAAAALHERIDLDLAIFLDAYREDLLAKGRTAERLAALGQLAASIGHELRNPLSVVESSAFLLRQRLAALAIDDAKLTKHLEKISAEVYRSNKTISDLLELARSQPVKREPISATALAERARDEARLPAAVDVHVTLPDGLVLHGDPDQLTRVLCNLLVNASQAMGGHGRVWIEGAPGAWLRVRDEGPGVPPFARTRLFEALFTTKANGHGLGLALSKRIAEAHGGGLALEDQGERPGASFVLTLPDRT